MQIQWYPGHMTKTLRRMEEDIRLVDAVIEVADARCVKSSRNPDLARLCGTVPSLLVLNRVDLADPEITARWRRMNPVFVELVATRPGAAKILLPALQRLLEDKRRRYAEKGQEGRGFRVMVTGIPNVGKSTLINNLLGRRAATAEDRPGVTRGRQWFSLGQGIDLMDTPGMLWPKFEDPQTGLHLAFTGAIRDEIMDREMLAMLLAETLQALYPSALAERYGIDAVRIADEAAREEPPSETQGPGPGAALLEAAARRRGYVISGGEPDFERMARTLLDEFRAGRLGRISLESPEGEESRPGPLPENSGE